jgi:hypothetical protein
MPTDLTVILADVQDRPGELGRVCRGMADAGVNLDLVDLSHDGKLVLGADDLETARGAL